MLLRAMGLLLPNYFDIKVEAGGRDDCFETNVDLNGPIVGFAFGFQRKEGMPL